MAVALVDEQLNAPCEDVHGCDEPDEPTRPAMQAGELVKVDLDCEGDSEDGEGRGFEGEQDDEGEQRESDDARPASSRPPFLLDRKVRLTCAGRGRDGWAALVQQIQIPVERLRWEMTSGKVVRKVP